MDCVNRSGSRGVSRQSAFIPQYSVQDCRAGMCRYDRFNLAVSSKSELVHTELAFQVIRIVRKRVPVIDDVSLTTPVEHSMVARPEDVLRRIGFQDRTINAFMEGP